MLEGYCSIGPLEPVDAPVPPAAVASAVKPVDVVDSASGNIVDVAALEGIDRDSTYVHGSGFERVRAGVHWRVTGSGSGIASKDMIAESKTRMRTRMNLTRSEMRGSWLELGRRCRRRGLDYSVVGWG